MGLEARLVTEYVTEIIAAFQNVHNYPRISRRMKVGNDC
jgi:hypothetical protein